MDADRFDALAKSLAAQHSRRGVLRSLARSSAGLVALFGLATIAVEETAACNRPGKKCDRRGRDTCCGGAKCQGGKCRCPRRKKRCRDSCIPKKHCCEAADCGPCASCQKGQCVSGCQPGQTCEDGFCRCTSASCTGCCTGETCRTGTNDDFCGAGGETCTRCGARRQCLGGQCVCDGNSELCGGQCVDTRTDDRHCGSCGNACVGTATCQNGACASMGEYRFLRAWSGSVDAGDFLLPFGVAVDNAGDVYVTDRDKNQIQKFDSAGSGLAFWAALSGPSGVTSNENLDGIFVANTNGNTIEQFTRDGNPGPTWPIGASPVGVAVNQNSGEVYVAASVANAIKRFRSDGVLIEDWQPPDPAYNFSIPSGVAVAPTGDVYVADTGNNRILRFSADGDPRPWITVEPLTAPAAVAVDDATDVYVATGNTLIKKFSADGTFIGSWGSEDGVAFDQPTGVAVSRAGYVHVADSGNGRIVQFEPD